MSNARNLARLIVDSGGDLDTSNLGNAIPADGTITASKLAAGVAISAGTIAYLGMSTAPTGWLKANGAAISRSTYADLFAAIGTTYGSGDGSTTFNIPDLRGEFQRGWDDGRGVDGGRGLGSYQADAAQRVTGAMGMSHASGMEGVNSWTPSGTNAFYGVNGGNPWRDQIESFGGTNYRNVAFDNARSVRTATEERPRNIALLACIKY